MMDIGNLDRLYSEKLSDRDFNRLGALIQSEFGIKMPSGKREMLEARLRKRLKALGLYSYKQYSDFLFTPEGRENELMHMIDVVSTNKTDFFREPEHFDFLVRRILPEMVSVNGAGISRQLMVWSAGCSSGEEPYTLGMVLSEFEAMVPGLQFQYTILATDISSQVLDRARRGVYTEEKIAPVPTALKQKYMMKSKDRSRHVVRMVPELRGHVRFRRLNFLDEHFGMREPVDIVFYRNVMIYFERSTQYKILTNILSCIRPGGYLFIGHSETLNKFKLPVRQVIPTVYRKEP